MLGVSSCCSRLRKLLRLHDEHYAKVWADRKASGVAALVEEQKRIEAELEAAAKEACSLGGHSAADIALQAASLLAAKLTSYYNCEAAPKVLQALLEVAEAAQSYVFFQRALAARQGASRL
jgi:hypothetical protein